MATSSAAAREGAAALLQAAAAAEAAPPRTPVRGAAQGAALPVAQAVPTGTYVPQLPFAAVGMALPDEPFVQLPDGKGYESEEEQGPTAELVLEDEGLIGLPERADKEEAPQAGPGASPTRSASVLTGADDAKKKTAAQERKETEDSKWTPLRTDGNETKCFGRPDFRPYKPGSEPKDFTPDCTHERGGPAPSLKLSHNSQPALWVAEVGGWDRQLFGQITSATNEYAAAKGAGSKEFWKEYHPFDCAEIMSGFGLLLRNGLAPVPQLSYMFKDPRTSFAFGDERARKAFPGTGCGGPDRRFTQFRSFCHIQGLAPENYKITDPATGIFMPMQNNLSKRGPLFKLEPLLSFMRYKWPRGWRLGMHLSLDEMTVGFKGRCALVTRIKYKKEGDGFQCDAICEDGYCFTFWYRCDTPPRVVPADVSARDDRCAWLVEQLPGLWYRLWMDNLFTSFKFGVMLAARNCLFGGTCQTADWRGLHSAVIQKEAKTVKAKAEARGTILASYRSEGITPECEVICTSYYDEQSDKPFHMMSNIVEGVSIIDVRKSCYSTATQSRFWVTLRRLSLGVMYNAYMNSVDVADQLRMTYRPDGLWLRNRKWWWSIMLWALGQAVTNAYVAYVRACEAAKRKPLMHLEFQSAVAEAWCNMPQLILNPKKATTAQPLAGGSAGASTSAKTCAPKNKAVYLTEAKLEKCKVSYANDPGAHQIALVPLGKGDRIPDCQLCAKGKGVKEGVRFQKEATVRCACCEIHVCGAQCWLKLHGTE